MSWFARLLIAAALVASVALICWLLGITDAWSALIVGIATGFIVVEVDKRLS